MDILIDFDGTCVKHDFPRIGENIGAEQVLRALVDNGHRLILFTMRCDQPSPCISDLPEIHTDPHTSLTDAMNWFKEHDIPLFGVQTHPDQVTWTTSPKAYGHMMIDDSAVGCPLKQDHPKERPYVDWKIVRKLLIYRRILPGSLLDDM